MDDRFSVEGSVSRNGRPARREFLTGLAALAATAVIPESLSSRQAQPLPRNQAGWIDVHHHFSPPAYLEITSQKKIVPGPMVGWSPQKTIEDMDRGGVATAMNSIVVPGVWFGDPEQARHLARDSNEYAAKLVADYPGRFGSFATVTIPDIDGSLREIEYALDVLKADGIALFTSYGDKWLGDPFFAPVFEELNRRNGVVFTHPTDNACCQNLLPNVPSAEIEYGTDTTRAIVRMVYSGAAQKYPNIRMIFSHGGGTMPYLIGRFVERVSRSQGNSGERRGRSEAATDEREKHDFRAEVGKFYYDTAQTFNPVPMTALKHVVPTSQILFGTDFPYRSSQENTMGLMASNAFDAKELEAIKSESALKLLPRLRK